jgi:methylmalonyl-CoA mutase C-terminal domain/subunit
VRSRVLIAKPGLDGHDRGARLIAKLLRDAGHEVIYMGIRNTPRAIASAAVAEDVDLVGLSILAGGHLGLLQRTLDELAVLGADDIPVIVGGVIPDDDMPLLIAAGAAGVYPSSVAPALIVERVQELLGSRHRQDTKESADAAN